MESEDFEYDLPQDWNFDNIFSYESESIKTLVHTEEKGLGVTPTQAMLNFKPPMDEVIMG